MKSPPASIEKKGEPNAPMGWTSLQSLGKNVAVAEDAVKAMSEDGEVSSGADQMDYSNIQLPPSREKEQP